MNVQPKAPASAPAAPQNAQPSPRDRAIQALMKGATNQAQAESVPNPSSVSPEEASAVIAKKDEEIQEVAAADGQTDTSETSAADPKEATSEPADKAEEPLSQQYAVLARKEKALRAKVQAQESAFKQRETELRAREQALSAKDQEYQSKYISKDRLAQDTLSVLQESGITYDQLTEMALNPPARLDPAVKSMIDSMKAEIEALKGETKSVKSTYEQHQQDAYKQALNQIRTEAKSLVANDPNFETIKEMGAHDEVVDLIEQTFKEDGVLMTVEEAAKAVEDYLIEEAMKVAKLKKIQERLKPVAAAPQKQAEAPKSPQAAKTLTNSIGATRPLSARERAVAAFKGQKIS